MLVLDEFALLISRVLGDRAISTERDPLYELIEPFTFVGGHLNRAAQLVIGKDNAVRKLSALVGPVRGTRSRACFCVSCC